MKRDISVSLADQDGVISYEILPNCDNKNAYELFAYRYLKLLLSDYYGGLLNGVRANKASANVSMCVVNTDRAVKRLAAEYPDSLYTIYDTYMIKTLDINTATSSLLLEIELVFKGGSTITIIL